MTYPRIGVVSLKDRIEAALSAAVVDFCIKADAITIKTDDGERVRIRFEADNHDAIEGVYVLGD